MEITQLEVLAAVAREKSFSRAAKVLYRTQPAVSQAIQRLEEEIGEKLFDRSSKDGTLTSAGEILLDYAGQILNLRQTARRAIKEMRDLHQGKVTISANEHTVFFLLPVIEEFHKSYPLIKVEVQRGVSSRIPKEVLARDVDFGLISFKPEDDSVKSIPVITDELTLIVAPNHPLANEKNLSVKDLGAENFIAHNAPSPYRQKVIETFEKQHTRLNISVELPSLEAIKKLVERGVGVALIPKLTALSEISDGRLKAVTVKGIKFERKLNIIYRRNAVLSHAAKVFLKIAEGITKG